MTKRLTNAELTREMARVVYAENQPSHGHNGWVMRNGHYAWIELRLLEILNVQRPQRKRRKT